MAAKGVSELSRLCRLCRGLGARVLRASLRAPGSKASCRSAPTRTYRSGRGKRLAQDQMPEGRGIRHRRLQPLEREGQALLIAAARHLRGRQARSIPARSAPGSSRPISTRLRASSSRSSAQQSPFEEVPAIERKDAVWLEPQARRRDRLCRADTRRTAAPSELQGAARGQARAREVHREQSNDEEADMATTTKSAARQGKGRCRSSPGSRSPIPDKVYYPDSRHHQARPRALLRDGRALHAALRGEAADQPGALPRGN